MEAEGFAAPGKPVLVEQRQVHARTLHRRQGLDGPASAPFEPRWKLSRSWNCVMPKRLASISSKPDTEPLGALRCQAQTHVVHPVGGEPESLPAIGVLVGHIHLRQLCDGAAILVRQIREQHPVVRLAANTTAAMAAATSSARPTQAHTLRAVHGGQPLQPCGAGGGSRASTTADILLSSMAGLARILA